MGLCYGRGNYTLLLLLRPLLLLLDCKYEISPYVAESSPNKDGWCAGRSKDANRKKGQPVMPKTNLVPLMRTALKKGNYSNCVWTAPILVYCSSVTQ